MARVVSLSIVVPAGSQVAEALAGSDAVRDDAVVVTETETGGPGKKDPPSPGTRVYALPNLEALGDEEQEIRRAMDEAGAGPEPFEIVVDHAAELTDEDVRSALDLAAATPRDVVLTVLEDG